MDQSANPLPPPPGAAPAAHLPPPTLAALPTLPTAAPSVGEPHAAPAAASPHVPLITPSTDGTAPHATDTTGGPPHGRGSRRGLMLTIAVLCLVALGVGAFLVVGGNGDDPESADRAPVDATNDDVELSIDDATSPPIEAGAYSFSNAAATVGESPGMRMSMTVTAPEGTVEMTALIDRRERRMSMEMSGEVPGLQPGMADMKLIADEPAATMYMSGELLGTEVPWISIDVAMFGDMVGPTEWFGDPADLGDLFAGTDPVDLGVETVDGEALRHYRVTLSVEDLLAADPSTLDGFGEADLTQLETLTYDVWVDEPGRLRRMGFDADVLGETVSLDMRLDHVDEPVSIPLPEPGDVIGLDELIGEDLGFDQLGD